jgi:predicted nucleotidyltransferase
VAALWVVGSVARGDAKPDSNVDLAIDFAPGAEVSLLDIAHLKVASPLSKQSCSGWKAMVTAN